MNLDVEIKIANEQYENVKNLTNDHETEIITEEIFWDTHPILEINVE